MSKERLLKLPSLIDSHVHLRDPGATQKEDFLTGTSAALAGGVTRVLDMPNNPQPTVTREALSQKTQIIKEKAVCDYGFYFGADQNNFSEIKKVVNEVCGLKIYLDSTHGPLLIDNLKTLTEHFKVWPGSKPICVHAEDLSVAKVLGLVTVYRKPVHFCHISQESEISLIKKAKEKGLPVTCEVTPHHLFLIQDDESTLGAFGKMKPPLRAKKDQKALWKAINEGVIDTIGSDHAPHTKEEKLSANPPYGVPGIETMLPLLLSAVSEKRLTLEKLVELTSTNPAKIFGLKPDSSSWVEIDVNKSYTIENSNLKTKCGWSPFDGMRVTGKVKRVFLRGQKVYENEKVLVKPGFGQGVYE